MADPTACPRKLAGVVPSGRQLLEKDHELQDLFERIEKISAAPAPHQTGRLR